MGDLLVLIAEEVRSRSANPSNDIHLILLVGSKTIVAWERKSFLLTSGSAAGGSCSLMLGTVRCPVWSDIVLVALRFSALDSGWSRLLLRKILEMEVRLVLLSSLSPALSTRSIDAARSLSTGSERRLLVGRLSSECKRGRCNGGKSSSIETLLLLSW